MLFSEGRGHEVVSTSDAETVGIVSDFIVDPVRRAVVAVQLKKASGGSVVRWPDLLAFGADAATVDGRARVTEPDEALVALTGKRSHVVGKRVLSTAGVQLGKVSDVEFDAATGAVVSLRLDAGDVAGERLVGVGSWAVVVREQ